MRRSPVVVSALVLSFAACHDADSPTQPDLLASPKASLLQAAGPVIPNRYVVVLRQGTVSATSHAARLVSPNGGKVFFVYEHALRGFAAELSPAAVEVLRRDPAVDYIEPDQVVSIFGTQSPTPS